MQLAHLTEVAARPADAPRADQTVSGSLGTGSVGNFVCEPYDNPKGGDSVWLEKLTMMASTVIFSID